MTIEMPNARPGRRDAGFGNSMRAKFIVHSTFISLTAFFQMNGTPSDYRSFHQSFARRLVG
ncbi:hypothetical protein [Bradyrhizobium sp. dw_411]|uniref:hypothetical protein n=1 Tax=Bradyrhizobium sp. dw_411 TaxID=2720082 RepID=UPI001BCE4D2D|nr:hypothetical protein [Bradyrhizobium sp. dw_411]